MKDELKKDNLIVQLTFDFAVSIVSFCELLEEKRKWSLANQLLRASLSIGANVKEAQNAESKASGVLFGSVRAVRKIAKLSRTPG